MSALYEASWYELQLAHLQLTLAAELNAQMRRIDLVCKLAGPFFISIIDGISTETAILVNLAMNLTSIVVEYYAIARVCRHLHNP